MVDSREKGARAEAALVKLLKQHTKHNWKRVPGSGALHEDHGLKGDVYVPNEHNYYAIEVKHYKDCQLTSKVLTDKNPMLLQWWEQAERQAKQTDKKPILFFKHDRSKWFVAFSNQDTVFWTSAPKSLMINDKIVVLVFEEFIQRSRIEKIKK